MTIDEKRDEIMQLDKVTVDYFQKRMAAVKDLAALKKKASAGLSDADFENRNMRELLSDVDGEYKEVTLKFIMHLLKISREYQSEVLS